MKLTPSLCPRRKRCDARDVCSPAAYMLFYNWFLMSLLCGYGGYNRERSERRDFLMQLQVSCLPCRLLHSSTPTPHPSHT